MNEKYYIPEVEDFYIGYEFEIRNSDFPDSEFEKGEITMFTHLGEWGYEKIRYDSFCEQVPKRIRVPYLTKEQIENEGWLVSAVDDFYNKTGNRLTYDVLSNELCIIQTPKITIDEARDWPEGKDNYNLFKGKCKSINEFRTIMKLLNIK